MTAATLELSWPDKRLSPNARLHWANLHSAKAAAARIAGMECLVQHVPRNINAKRVVAGFVFLPPDRRARDLDNLVTAMKAAQDGIAKWIGVDDSRWVPTYEIGEPVKGGKVIINLRWIDSREQS